MWSFEKIHRCMAHLFLGQLVSTFDEEFRILFAQSEPLIIENTFMPMDNFSLTQRRQYPSERPSLYKDSRKFLSPEVTHSEEWGRLSYDDRVDMDWRLRPKRKEILNSPGEIYNRFPSQQMRMDPSFEHSSSRMPLMENPAFKCHSYAEGVQDRYPFLSMPEPENQGRQFPRPPYLGLGKESEYSSYDKFRNQDFHLPDQYSDPTFAHEMEPPDNFEPALNYFSSARDVEFDQSSDKMSAAAIDLPFSSTYPKRLCAGQPYACQKSPTPSKSAEQKSFFPPEPNPDRKDPSFKRGLRNWRISSYLSTYDSKEDESLSLEPHNVSDPFEDPSILLPPKASHIDFSTPKIPNVREFKVPAMPRASQIPGYAKNLTREQSKKLPDELSSSVVEETKATPSPSESSSTTEGERLEEAEPKEHITSRLNREDSFRRKYNAAVPRCSRLRSSLIFSSLEQQHAQDGKSTPGQPEEESGKTEGEPTKQSLIAQFLGQRKTTREPFEWSRYINKSATFDSSATDSSKPDKEKNEADGQTPSNDENTKDPSEKNEESLKPPNVEQIEQTNSSPSVSRSKPVSPEQSDKPTNPNKSLLSASSYIDVSDPDALLMFFKELAAKRKAEKADKSKEMVQVQQPTVMKSIGSVKKETSGSEEMTGKATASTISTKGEEEEKSKEEVFIKQLMELDTTSSGKQDESGPEETRKETASTVTAEDKYSIPVVDSVKCPTEQKEAGLIETTDKMAATAKSTKTPQEKESTQNISDKHPMEKYSISVEQEDLGPNDCTENMREAVIPTKTMKEETREEKSLKKIQTDLKNSNSLKTEISDNEPVEKVSLKLFKPEANILIKDQDANKEETTEKRGDTAVIQPVEPKSNTTIEKEEPGPKETIDETAVLAMAVDMKPPANLQNVSSVKRDEPCPGERYNMMAAPGGTASGVEAEKCKEKFPSKHPVELEPETFAIKEESDAKDMAETFAAASLSTKAAEAEKTKENVQMTQPSKLIFAKHEEHVPEKKDEKIPAENVSEHNRMGGEDETDHSTTNICELQKPHGSTDPDMITMETNPASTLFVSAVPPSPPEKSGFEISSTPSALSSSSDPLVSEISTICPSKSLNAEHSVNSSLQEVEEKCVGQTELEPALACQDSASQVMPPESPLADDFAHARSELCLEGFVGESEPHTSSPETVESLDPELLDPDKTVPKSENNLLVHVTEEQSENLGITLQASANGTPPSLSPQKADKNETPVSSPSTPNAKSEHFPEETQSNSGPDSTTNASQSDITATSPSDLLPSSKANLTGPVSLSRSETASSLSQSESAEPVLSPEVKETQSLLHSPSHIPSFLDKVSIDLKSPVLPSTDLCHPTESTSKVPPVSDLPCKLPKAVICENQSSEPHVPTQNSKEDSETEVSCDSEMPETVEEKNEITDITNNSSTARESAHSEKENDQVRTSNYSEPQEVTPGDVIPPALQSKLPKSSQSRYHSSTANVISSSNLRDDTKLFLEQMSANSQSRHEVSKDSPVTDDEKEDEADKNAKRKERGITSFNRGQPKSNQERDKVLERIQSMRKERKVYSRFEV